MLVRTILVVVALVAACSSEPTASRSVGSPTNHDAQAPQPTSTTDADPAVVDTAAVVEETEPEPPSAFNGRVVPRVATSAQVAASLFTEVHAGLRIDGQEPLVYADLGHTEQLVIRWLVRNSQAIDEFRSALSPHDLAMADLHLTARSELSQLHAGGNNPSTIPAWTIIDPEPLDDLVTHYKRAGEATGIEWQVLAGMNLIETAMGRIGGLSTAGAQGPMQFLPTTWDEVSEGGDINDPGDAIDGAARYLVQRGGLDDIRAGLFGYNRSQNYVNAVLAYAELVKLDESSLLGFYNWEVYVGTEAGTLWLPVGYQSAEATPAIEYAQQSPWALTLG